MFLQEILLHYTEIIEKNKKRVARIIHDNSRY